MKLKKFVSAIGCASLIAVLLIGASGCSSVEKELKEEIREEINENAVQPKAPNAVSPSAVGEEPANTTYIGEEKAKEIALSNAGFDESEVSGIIVHLDYDDDYGIMEYNVEFRKDKTEYEYEINAETGDVTDFDKDRADFD